MRGLTANPLNDWRKFVGEVAIIVIGVLIALVAQQFADDRNWDRQVREARESLDDQLNVALYAATERVARGDCMTRQLNRLDALTNRLELPPINHVPAGILRTWGTSAWESATASGAVAHMDRQTRELYAAQVHFTNLLGEMSRKEFDVSAPLATVKTHRSLDPITRDRLQGAIASTRSINEMMQLGSGQWIEGAKPLKLKILAEDRAYLREIAATCPMPDDPPKRA